MDKNKVKEALEVLQDPRICDCRDCECATNEAQVTIQGETGGKFRLTGWVGGGCPHCGGVSVIIHKDPDEAKPDVSVLYTFSGFFECPSCFAVVAWEEIQRHVDKTDFAL